MFRCSLPCFRPKATRGTPGHNTPIAFISQGLQIRLHVKPNSRKEGITEVRDDRVHVAVAGLAREGGANRDVIQLMSELLGLRKGDVSIVSGQRSRDKVMLVHSGFSSLSEGDRSEEHARILQKLIQAVRR